MQIIGISKFLPVMWYFVIINVVFLNSVLLETNNFSNVCCTECSCNITESGECSLLFQEKCDSGTCIHLNFAHDTSIIEMVVSAEHLQNTTNLTESKSVAATDGEIKLDISEFDNEAKYYVLLETRDLNVKELEAQTESYLTRTSKALICVTQKTKSSRYKVNFSFKEWEYSLLKPEVENPLKASGEILGKYVPNSVSLYQLPKDPEVKWKGIEITIQGLEIDTESGEYLLIGGGSPEDFPPRFLSQIAKYSLFYVANASAYIEFISRSTVKKDETFKILWNRIGAEMLPTVSPVDTLNAILVCFSNYSEAKEEFEGKNDLDEVFPKFREAFAESVRNYTKQKFDCTKSSVKFLGHHTKVRSSDALSILLLLQCEERIFRYQELQKIMKNFEIEDKNKTLGYKVGLCQEEDLQRKPYKEEWSYLIYALVPTFALFILLIWAWRNNIFNQKCSSEKEEDLTIGIETNSIPAEPNTYEATTVPKICLVDGQGRRQTLIPGSSEEDADRGDSGNVTAVEMNAIPSTSQESDTLIRVLANRKSKRRPSIQSLLSKNDEDVSNKKSDGPKPEGDESEHLYDSVSSTKAMSETKL